MKSLRWLMVAVAATALSGCELALLEGGSMMATQKTFSDHVVSLTSNKDCSTYRKNTTGTYCKEDEVHPTPKVHCYRTLGEVTCYEDPDPSGRPEVGRNDQNYDENAKRQK